MKAPKIIVIGIDFSNLSELAVDTGFTLARRFRAERVHLVHINDESIAQEVIGEEVDDWQRKMANEKLATIDSRGLNVTREVRDGIPSRDLAKAAEAIDADLIVVATQGMGVLRRAVLGSVTAALLRTAECPVLVVGEDRRDLEFQTVVTGVVPAPIAREVVEHAVIFAGRDGQVEIVSSHERPAVVNDESLARQPTPSDVETWQSARVRELEALVPKLEHGPKVHIDAVEKSPPAELILDTAKTHGADLIVVGTSGRNFWHRMVVGSTATHVVAEAKCPVLVVPAREAP